MERENDSHMDKYLHKHLRRDAPAERPQGGRSPQPHSNPGKGKGGKLKHMKETSPAKGKGAPNLFYCQPTDDEGGPCHAPDCDGRSSCMLQLQRKQKTKDGQEVKHQDHFRCTITCGYCGKRRHYEDECHINCRESEELKKAKEERRKNAGKGGGVVPLGELPVEVTLEEGEGTPHRPQVKNQARAPRVSSLGRSKPYPLPPVPVGLTRETKTPRSAASTGAPSACRRRALK